MAELCRVVSMNLKYKVEYIPVQNFMECESFSPVQHEYIDGTVYAIARARLIHN